VLASTPSYDPNDPKTAQTFNRATQGRYPPGSTFKAVTAAAALDSGRYTPNSQVDGSNHQIVSGAPLDNFGGEDFGSVDLTFALTQSINTVWAQVGVKLGKSTMADYMRKFGFYDDPPMDFPDDQMLPSGEYRNGRLLPPGSRFIDVGRMAIGQDKLLVTPLQMAEVAQAIANGGMRMKPRIVEKVVDPDGRTIDHPLGQDAQRVMSGASAAALTQMMYRVVNEGTGTAAALTGVKVAGKTGTAEIDPAAGINDLWFIGFTPTVAVAVVIERQTGTGGVVAAPVAKAVLQALGQ
jgi:peptidoglycan glycosyltransferase